MKTKSFLIIFVAITVIGIAGLFVKKGPSTSYNDVEKFITSSTFRNFQRNSSIKLKNLDLKQITQDRYEEVDGVVFYIPVIKGKRLLGTLAVFSKNHGQEQNMLFSDYRNVDKGSIVVTTSQLIVAKFSAKKIRDRIYCVELMEVPSNPVKIKKKRGILFEVPIAEAKKAGGSWWRCTTQCYSDAKSACNGDATCNFLCDLADITGQCTISIAAACGIYCM